jgi:uncharacterized protein YidB (DUF937 family)
MDLMNLLKVGATLIQNDSDKATSGLDIGDITTALSGLLGNSSGSGLDLSSIMSGLAQSGLSDTVGSWLGSGQNASISPNEVSNLLGEDKVAQFASQLGISKESAAGALAGILPEMVDKATQNEGSAVDDLLSQVGGAGNALNMLGKMFG